MRQDHSLPDALKRRLTEEVARMAQEHGTTPQAFLRLARNYLSRGARAIAGRAPADQPEPKIVVIRFP